MRALLGRKKNGVVAIIGSIAGYTKHYAAPIYSATKHAIVGFTRSMGDAEQLQGVKVVAICPGIVMTPIWTPSTKARFGVTDEVSLKADAVAAAISEAIESPDIPGGTILEISLGSKRIIPEWGIAPPAGTGDDGEPSKGTAVPPEAVQRALRPIIEITEAERGRLLKRMASL
ncbi:hypothetical protein KVR01_011594 [Diaporthe batatas]|uniref:uncharacterized protein n=1 Tax=Diaporthe batatas TaxID=748121 RepID=UPI001D043C6F|nr:uncharacterized protein KVR01_011594 [Diaporthe batatas]KAG8158472.1 hypothetical protein KVR01_011594 [Diaporthe batatas]